MLLLGPLELVAAGVGRASAANAGERAGSWNACPLPNPPRAAASPAACFAQVDQRLHREERADRDGEAQPRPRRAAASRAAASRRSAPPAAPRRGRMNIARTTPEVVVEADERREHADDHEPRPAVLVRGGEDVELADEAPAERQAGEAEHEHPHRDAEERPLPAEPGEVRRTSPARRARARARRRPRTSRTTSPRRERGSRAARVPPRLEPAAIAISMKPACEIDEYASIRLTSFCTSAARLPITSERRRSRRPRHVHRCAFLRERRDEHAEREHERRRPSSPRT